MNGTPRWMFVAPFSSRRRGTVRYRTYAMARALASRGASVLVVVPNWDAPGRVEMGSLGPGVRVMTLPLRGSPSRLGGIGLLFAWLEMAFRALQVARDWHPDLVHLVKPITVPFFFLAATRGWGGVGRQVTAPVVLDCDDLEMAWTSDVPLAWAWGIGGSRLEMWAWRAADHITAASPFLLRMVRTYGRKDRRARGGNSGAKAFVWVPNVAVIRSDLPRRARSSRLVIPTRLLDIRPSVLAGWLGEIVRAVADASILVVGPDSRRAAALEQEIRRVGVENHVAVVALQEEGSYYRLLASARMGLYAVEDTPASRAKCPQRLLDMMGVGLPVVAVDVGSLREMVGDAMALVEPDGRAIARAIRDVWHMPDALVEMSRAARRLAHESFSVDAMAGRLLDLYSAICGGTR